MKKIKDAVSKALSISYNEFKEAVPFALAVGYIALLFFRTPNFADAIVAVAILSLAGFKYFLDSKKQPDLKLEFERELKKRDEELSALKGQVGKVSLTQQRGGINDNFRW